jgi:peptidylprolyl isomerase
MELNLSMKTEILTLLLAASTTAAIAQTAATPTTSAAKPASSAAKPATGTAKPAVSATKTANAAAKPATSATPAAHAAATAGKLPPGIPPVKGIVKTAFSERWEDIKIGTGADAVANKVYKVHYTGYLAADGKKFDSSYDHPGQPVKDKDGKPVLDKDGKPMVGDPQPIAFPQGFGRLIPGFDQGFDGMKVGGKRRIFIPWQLAYGEKGHPGPDPAHPGIPPKADLIFDVELVDISDLPAQPTRPMQVRPSGAAPPKPGAPGTPPPAGQPGAAAPGSASPAPAAAPATPPASTAPAASAPSSTTAPAQPQSK